MSPRRATRAPPRREHRRGVRLRAGTSGACHGCHRQPDQTARGGRPAARSCSARPRWPRRELATSSNANRCASWGRDDRRLAPAPARQGCRRPAPLSRRRSSAARPSSQSCAAGSSRRARSNIAASAWLLASPGSARPGWPASSCRSSTRKRPYWPAVVSPTGRAPAGCRWPTSSARPARTAEALAALLAGVEQAELIVRRIGGALRLAR